MQRTAFILILALFAALSRESFAPDPVTLEERSPETEKSQAPDYSVLPEAVFPPANPTERETLIYYTFKLMNENSSAGRANELRKTFGSLRPSEHQAFAMDLVERANILLTGHDWRGQKPGQNGVPAVQTFPKDKRAFQEALVYALSWSMPEKTYDEKIRKKAVFQRLSDLWGGHQSAVEEEIHGTLRLLNVQIKSLAPGKAIEEVGDALTAACRRGWIAVRKAMRSNRKPR